MSPTGHHLDDDLTRPPDLIPNYQPNLYPTLMLNCTPTLPNTRYQTDPDPFKTTNCTTPHFPDTPLVQWAFMIDAGPYPYLQVPQLPCPPRVRIRSLQNGQSGEQPFEVCCNPEEAARSLDVLMDEAMRTAMAELRMLGASKSAEVLVAVKIRLESAYPFPLLKGDGVVIMDGKDEGIYAWIPANYLLDTIRSSASKKDSTTYAVLELGGASTQIVFEPTFIEPGAKFEEGDHKDRQEFSGRSYVLYQHSYLGYGLMQARKSVHRLLDFLHSREKEAESEHVANLCLARGTEGRVEIDDGVMQLVMAKHDPRTPDVRRPGILARALGLERGRDGGTRRKTGILSRFDVHACAFDGGVSVWGEREVRIAKQEVEGTEMGWCLGATIVMLDRTKLRVVFTWMNLRAFGF
ncbi:nucleoside phosphatase family-domain-containing protein [Hysterangium stoloniferum]|nr:nucleoside phosphatase family-domain-containing protein [Hysterangium stoloniferum]